MDNSSVTVEEIFVWAFQYATQFESWLRFSSGKFDKHSVVCEKNADWWQAPF